MSWETTVLLRARVLELALEHGEEPQEVILELLASCLSSASDDPTHVYGPAMVARVEEHLLQALEMS